MLLQGSCKKSEKYHVLSLDKIWKTSFQAHLRNLFAQKLQNKVFLKTFIEISFKLLHLSNVISDAFELKTQSNVFLKYLAVSHFKSDDTVTSWETNQDLFEKKKLQLPLQHVKKTFESMRITRAVRFSFVLAICILKGLNKTIPFQYICSMTQSILVN